MTSKKDKPKRYRNLKPAWKPGQAGNPQGRPPRDVQQRELLSQLADHGDEALATVIAVMRKARASAGDAVKLRAAQDVLDRLIGRPTQSLAASVIQRTIAHDGTLIEGSAIGAMSPLLQAAHAHFAEEEMRQLAAPKTEPAPEPSPPPPPAVIALPDESVVPSESAPLESTTRPPSEFVRSRGLMTEVPQHHCRERREPYVPELRARKLEFEGELTSGDPRARDHLARRYDRPIEPTPEMSGRDAHAAADRGLDPIEGEQRGLDTADLSRGPA